ncbi:hypothetical protein SUGI_0402810 [Cryptomeria japonica]|uniref:5'-adenylylsulfate reductase-like 5 n=1 Tax=Cryptomeria japonica TaxID=3369 RepID=UPI002408B39D|nr:5'-adenylylsulfate reductase-like 5 [Cryptomeria japonica]GLJ21634.1 hypothetical protein SUGI_0402810 [Cryptomeria japonica]
MAATVRFILALSLGLSLGLLSADGKDTDSCRCPSLSEVTFASLEEDMCALTPPLLNPPRVIQLDDVLLERTLDFQRYNRGYMAMLFHASWCPFSKTCRSVFDILSSLFPNIHHVAIEESAVMPSVLSRNGVHSFPSLFLQNQTSRVHYHGSKDLKSLVLFYKEITGVEPINSDYLAKDYRSSFSSHFGVDYGQSKEYSLQQEPYLIFALLFLTARVLLYLFPKVLVRIKHCQFEDLWHLNLARLGENASPFLKHALHMVNLNRIWSRLKRSKTRNFQEGAKNARVWASSLASVSLGKGSANRSGTSSESR